MTNKVGELDYRGARGSNTGDEYHELWAVRQAIRLLDQQEDLTALTVEGLSAAEGSGTVWDGVDCGLFFGGECAADAARVEIQQLKYSAADPKKPWTVARIATGRAGRPRSSPIGRLADAYARLRALRKGKVNSSLRISLVSNQPISDSLIEALGAARQTVPSNYKKPWKSGDPDLHRLVHASGLSPTEFQSFASVLDLKGATGSRFAVEDEMLTAVAQWSEGEFSEAARRLREFIRKRMLPEAFGEIITPQRILLQFGVSDPQALFPCPSAIARVNKGVSRTIAKTLVEDLGSFQRLCLHGAGGVGKTTILQEMDSLLPPGSEMIVFDCYGGGSYLDASAYRHRSSEAFIQLSNEVALRLRIPLMLDRRNEGDLAREFHRRLKIAASAMESARPEALLVLCIDAADNSVTAATTRNPPETSFVHELMSFQSLPKNVRLVVSARTGRLDELHVPAYFKRVELPAFTELESALNVARHWTAPANWLADFHHLSDGVPRVQAYAFDSAGNTPSAAVDALRPLGKKLEHIFRDQFENAFLKIGRAEELERVCAGLIALARPIPVAELAAILNMPHPLVIDICGDLSPGVRTTGGVISFADEDFEAFVREAAQLYLPELQAAAATRFLERYNKDPYAALNVAPALLVANRSEELLDLVEATPEPAPELVADPVVRQEIRLQRLRIAIKVCREAGDAARALRYVLIGAEAINTEAETIALLVAHPGLTARYARETASRLILGDSGRIPAHGPLLLQLLAEDAATGDAIAVREGRRRIHAWSDARKEDFEAQNSEFGDARAWDISADDGAASIYATLLTEGVEKATAHHRMFRPFEFSVRSAKALVERLVTEGRFEVLEKLASDTNTFRAIFFLVPIAMAGKQVDLDRLAAGLLSFQRRGALDPASLRGSHREDDIGEFLIDTALSGAEILTARGGRLDVVKSILSPFMHSDLRRIDKRHDFETALLDAILRSYCLNEAIEGKAVQSADVLTSRLPIEDGQKRKTEESSGIREHDDRLRSLLSAVTEVYSARAQLLVDRRARVPAYEKLNEGQRRFQSESWRFDRSHSSGAMRAKMAEGFTVLLAADADPDEVMTRALSLVRNRWIRSASGIEGLFTRLAGVPGLHNRIVREIIDAATSIRREKAGAQDKSRTLANYARLVAPLDPAEADAIFEQAIEVASELDSEVMDQVRLIDQLVQRGVGAMGDATRENANLLSEVVHDASIRLQDVEHFPWDSAVSALATLNIPIALGCLSRWDDEQVVSLSQSLQSALAVALSTEQMTPSHAAVLISLLDRSADASLNLVLEKADLNGGTPAELLAEEFAHDILVDRLVPSSHVEEFIARRGKKGEWTKALAAQKEFLSATIPPDSLVQKTSKYEPKPRPVLEGFAWQEQQVVDGELLATAMQKLLADSREAGEILSLGDILSRARTVVSGSRRIDHLNALLRAHELNPDRQLIEAVFKAIEAWSPSPAITSWSRLAVPKLMLEHLPDFACYLPWDDSLLNLALLKAEMTDEQHQSILLRGIERNSDQLSAATTFALAGKIGSKLAPQAASDLCGWYLERLAERISPEERENVPKAALPGNSPEAFARMLYAFLGDVDVRIRWRAAHCVRRLARLGLTDHLVALSEQYSRTADPCFRDPKAPYYWLASRLWLVVSLDRVAHESPSAIAALAPFLLRISQDEDFPHLLVRAYAADACRKLLQSGFVSFSSSEIDALDKVNISVLPAGTKDSDYGGGFDRMDLRKEPKRRFHFNGLDTLRYWYQPWLRAFDDIEPDSLLDIAENWIVDKWGVRDEEPYGSKEPRTQRFTERNWSLSSTSHGSRPTLENHRSYLEWHAIWCAAGELLRTNRVKPPAYDDSTETELQYQLKQEKLTHPPVWLADLVGPTPRIPKHWLTTEASVPSDWTSAPDKTFLDELLPSDRPGYVVAEMHGELRQGKFVESAKVLSGLVSPETASSLVRALQTTEDPSNFYICPENHDLEIKETDYKLLGWLTHMSGDLGIDEKDIFRNGVRRLEAMPGRLAHQRLGLTMLHSPPMRWFRSGQSEPAFIYEAWGERERQNEFWFEDGRVVSSGYRLLARIEDLQEFLEGEGLDLIVEVEIRRREQREEYLSHNAQKAQKSDFGRILHLRRDGAIDAAERSLGAWHSAGS